MSRTLTYLVFILFMLLQAELSEADQGRGYLGGQVGMFLPIKSSVSGGNFPGSSAELTFDPGIAVLAAGGYQFGNGLRAEEELNFRYLTNDKITTQDGRFKVHGSAHTFGFMTNLYYDFRNRSVVTPYLGAGVGGVVGDFSRETSEGSRLWPSGSDLAIAYQGIAGFAYRVGNNTSVDFSYRHYAVPRFHFQNLSAQFRGPTLSLGLRHWF